MSDAQNASNQCVPYGKANTQYETEFETARGIIWGYFNPPQLPCCNLDMLKDMLAHDQQLIENAGRVEVEGKMRQVNYYVTGSRTPGVFNLGGDLALFVRLIKSRDRAALADYAKLCIDIMHPRAERIGMDAAEKMILSGRIFPAAKLHDMGLVDVLIKDGDGATAVREWIARNDKRRNGMQAAFRARRCVHPVTRQEMDAVVNVWVDAAFRLTDRDLRMMDRIVKAQTRRKEIGEVMDVATGTPAEENGTVS